MFFDKQTKQAFVFPTKTGTIAARHFLGLLGWHGVRPLHGTPAEFINKYPALENYAIYGFLRDPLQRFQSAILHTKQSPIARNVLIKLFAEKNIDKTVELATYDEFIVIYDDLVNRFNELFSPQIKWLNHPKVTVLDFRNIEAELRRITGNTTQEFKRWNASSDFGRSVITPAVEEFVRQQYADDYRLWGTLNGA